MDAVLRGFPMEFHTVTVCYCSLRNNAVISIILVKLSREHCVMARRTYGDRSDPRGKRGNCSSKPLLSF